MSTRAGSCKTGCMPRKRNKGWEFLEITHSFFYFMPAAANPLAITEVDYVNCTKVDVEKKMTEAEPLLNISDEIVEGDARDPIFEMGLEGKGDLPDGLVAGEGEDLAVAGVTGGKTIITNSEETEYTDKYNEWTVAATNWPNAS